MRGEELSHNGTISKNQVKRFSSLAELKLLDFTHKDTTGGYYKKEEKNPLLNIKEMFYFAREPSKELQKAESTFCFVSSFRRLNPSP